MSTNIDIEFLEMHRYSILGSVLYQARIMIFTVALDK